MNVPENNPIRNNEDPLPNVSRSFSNLWSALSATWNHISNILFHAIMFSLGLYTVVLLIIVMSTYQFTIELRQSNGQGQPISMGSLSRALHAKRDIDNQIFRQAFEVGEAERLFRRVQNTVNTQQANVGRIEAQFRAATNILVQRLDPDSAKQIAETLNANPSTITYSREFVRSLGPLAQSVSNPSPIRREGISRAIDDIQRTMNDLEAAYVEMLSAETQFTQAADSLEMARNRLNELTENGNIKTILSKVIQDVGLSKVIQNAGQPNEPTPELVAAFDDFSGLTNFS
jgi:hypothetical protein